MEHATAYYQSPVGTLKMQCAGNHLHTLVFTEENTTAGDVKHPVLAQCRLELDEYFSGLRRQFSVPLQQEGTTFQQTVWSLLQNIPFGKTISYNQLSQQYGNLLAIRAVAAANGKNNIAILVPCHRVIGSNGSLTGYAGGLWRKKWLLEHEAKHFSGVQPLPF